MRAALPLAIAVLLQVAAVKPVIVQSSSSTTSQSTVSPTAPSTSVLPNDPGELLQLALNENGMHGSNLQPWHIRATWQTQEDQDKPADQGSWEEWWVSDEKYKITYKSATVDQTFFGTNHGRYVLSPSSKTSWQFMTVERLIQRPIGAVRFAAPMETDLRFDDVQLGGILLHCVVQTAMTKGKPLTMLNQRDGKNHPAEFGYCFVGDVPALRREWGGDGGVTAFNSPVRFQGQYLARKIRSVGAAGAPETDISLDLVEPIETVNDADFALPTGAVLVSAGKPAGGSGKTN